MARLARWSPFAELEAFQRQMDRLFREFFGDLTRREPGAWLPPVDIYETEDKLVLQAELPGFNKDQIHIDVTDDRVTIRGQRESERKDDRTYHLIERWDGQFERSFRLGVEVEADKAEAHYRDGILTVEVPKKEARKSRRITISG
ncbi:MAG: Hsp20/alpha crystallin family protein [Armatimonadetes bacterium]|nr:Hsp20/alpha crystallin family protein [Armatimonadota bacterium]MDW8122581.1 Hsp20/alpha crystallin family protein [Armatimonadota bacterium]